LTGTQAAAARPRRSDAGQARLTERDITGMLLVAEQYAAPYDLLGQALAVPPARVRAITARWRGAGYAVTGVLGPGPAWCWLTPAGMAASGHAWPARPPSLSRLAHVRAVLAARLWLQAVPAYATAGAWWRCERDIREGLPPPRVGTPHIPDAEVAWPSTGAAGPPPTRPCLTSFPTPPPTSPTPPSTSKRASTTRSTSRPSTASTYGRPPSGQPSLTPPPAQSPPCSPTPTPTATHLEICDLTL
jgi:hypothetical protein